eukprot:gene25789-31549_t
MRRIIDLAGQNSAKAQGLGAVITDFQKVRGNSDHTLYILAKVHSQQKVEILGILKVGAKNLFIQSATGAWKEMKPLCVLDFYVHESCQEIQLIKLDELVWREYDRPSPKLMGFLAKHYGLKNYVPQSNNFVVFQQYWEHAAAQTSGNRSNAGAPRA